MHSLTGRCAAVPLFPLCFQLLLLAVPLLRSFLPPPDYCRPLQIVTHMDVRSIAIAHNEYTQFTATIVRHSATEIETALSPSSVDARKWCSLASNRTNETQRK